MIKDLPAKEEIGVVLPARFASENSGNRSGILGGGKPKSLGLGALASPAGTGTPR
jgi:hypothetical protein